MPLPMEYPNDVTQHLCDAAADARRTDVPNAGSIETAMGLVRGTNELVDSSRSDKAREPMGREGWHLDIARLRHGSISPRNVLAEHVLPR